MATTNGGPLRAPDTTVVFTPSTITIAVGETATINYVSGMAAPSASTLDTLFGGIATAEVNGGGTVGTVVISGVSAGTASIERATPLGNGATMGSDGFSLTVTAPVDDDEFLNKRGLTHFWENIDDLKQDKLTAGDNISITSNTISADTGWVYLGEQSLSADSDTLTYALPAQYDNYKVVFYGAMDSAASDGGWIDFIMYNGSTAISVTHQVQLVQGTTWSSATNANVTFAINGQSNPYAGVTIKFESYRAGDSDWRSYTGSFASNNSVGASIRTSIVNGRATSGAQPTAFTVKSYGGDFNTGSRMRVWASNNEH